MQLKRDTDYALRILFCLKRNAEDRGPAAEKGLTLTEIAAQTKTPKTVAGRVCDNLKEKGIICLAGAQDAAEKSYYSTGEQLNCSLLDIIEAIEGTGQLFAVFDKRSDVYKNCETQIRSIQKRTEKVLAKATLCSLFESKSAV